MVGVTLRSLTAGQFSTRWGHLAAAATLGALPIIALFYGFQRYLMNGTVSGGGKEWTYTQKSAPGTAFRPS